MGQYIGDRKIGTCESMYYMRLSEAQQLSKEGKADDDGISFSEYLKDNETKWRFPFPDEDEGIPADCKYNKSFTIPVGEIEVNHTDICVSNSIDDSYNVNIFMPCPYSEEFKKLGLKTSINGVGEQFLLVTMEAIREGKRKTIFECARCHQMQRFSDDDIVKIKARATEHYKIYDTSGKGEHFTGGNQGLYDYAIEVIKRIF